MSPLVSSETSGHLEGESEVSCLHAASPAVHVIAGGTGGAGGAFFIFPLYFLVKFLVQSIIMAESYEVSFLFHLNQGSLSFCRGWFLCVILVESLLHWHWLLKRS